MKSPLPPIVMIPGMQCDEVMFEAVIDRLRTRIPGAKIEVQVLRQPGLDAAVSALASELDQPVVLIGHSLGGTVAMALAREFPESVAGLALVCASPRPPRPSQLTYWTGLIRRIKEGDLLRIVDEIVPELVGSTTSALAFPSRISTICRRMALATGAEGLSAQLRIQLDRIDERPALGAYPGPVLALAADDDCLVPAEAVRDISTSAARGDFALLAGATHMAPLTAPGAVASTLETWLRDNFNLQSTELTSLQPRK
jgi:pimeloyl-ACP methyl ester carboxylesterase